MSWIIKIKCKCGDMFYYTGRESPDNNYDSESDALVYPTRLAARELAKDLTFADDHFHYFAVKR